VAKDISKLISYLQSNPVQGRSTAPSGSLGITYNLSSQPVQKSDLVDDVVQGSMNVAGTFLRGVTALGRGVTNLAYGTLPGANEAYRIAKDGVRPDELGGYAGAMFDSVWGGLKGLTAGVGYSFAEPTQKTRNAYKDIFGFEPVEGAYELFKSDEFAQSAKNLPFLEGARSEEVVATTPAPGFDIEFLGIEKGVGMPITPTGLWSFGWDVLLDPASWATLGLGGAAKGAVSGVSKSVAAAKTKAAFPDRATAPSAQIDRSAARPFYGTKVQRSLPLTGDAAYNAIDTNPFTFIAKETGRGFVESHKNVMNIAKAKRQARLEKKQGLQTFNQAALRLHERGVDIADNPEALLSEIDKLADEVRTLQREKIDAQEAVSQADKELEKVAAGDALLRSVEIAKNEVQFSPERRARIAELVRGMDPESARTAIRADEIRGYASTIKNRIKLLPERVESKFEPELLETLAGRLNAAHGVDSPDVAPALLEFINEAKAKGNVAAIEEMLNTLFAPIGYRERYRGTALAEDGAAARKSMLRTPTQSREMEKLQGLVKSDLTRVDPRATKGRGIKGSVQATASDINDVVEGLAARFSGQNAGELFTSGYLKNLAEEISNFSEADLAKFAADVNKALDGSTRVFAARMAYGAERDKARLTPEKSLIEKLKGLGSKTYNPFTIQVNSTLVSQLGAGATRNRARLLGLLSRAGGDMYDANAAEILKKAGVKRLYASNNFFASATDALHAILYLKAAKKNSDLTLKAFNTRLGKVSLADQLSPEVRSVTPEQFEGIKRRAEEIAPNGAKVTDEEFQQLVALLGSAKVRQLDAQTTAMSDFSIPFHGNGNQLLALGNTDFSLAEKIGRRRMERFAPTRAADEIGKIKGAFKSVKDDIGVDENGNLKLGQALKDVAKQANSPDAKKLVEELGQIIFKRNAVTGRRTAIQIPASNTQLVQEIKREIGNAITKAERNLPREGVPGFTEVFTGLSGEFRTGTLSDFMGASYAASRRSDSLDGGRFADYVDEVFLADRSDLPPGWAGSLTVSERAKVLSAYAGRWSGEGLTPGLLQYMVSTYSKAGKATSSAKEAGTFTENIRLIKSRLKDSAAINLAATDEFKTFDSSAGWLREDVNKLKSGEKQLTPEELKAAREAFFGVESAELSEANWAKVTSEIKKMFEDAYYGGDEATINILKAAGIYKEVERPVRTKGMKVKTYEKLLAKAVEDAQEPFRRFIAGPRILTGKFAFAIAKGGMEKQASVAFGREFERLLQIAQRAGEEAVIGMRARRFIDKAWPVSADVDVLAGLPKKMSIGQAYVAMQAEMLLSKATMIQDAKILKGEADNLRRVPRGDAEGLKKEVTRLNSAINLVDRKLNKMGFPQVSGQKIASMSFEDVVKLDNPRAVIAKIRSMPVVTQKENREFLEALGYLERLDKAGETSLFRSGPELIQAWESGAPEVSEEVIQTVIAKYGYRKAESFLRRGKVASRDTLIKWVKDSRELIDQAELERARLQNVYAEAGLLADDAAEVKAAIDSMPVPEVHRMIKELHQELVDLVASAQANDFEWLPNLAISSMGESAHLFFRLVAQAMPEGTAVMGKKAVKVDYRGQEMAIKPTKETFTQYVEWAMISDGVREYARTAFPGDSLAQDTLVQKLATQALRIRGLYSLLRGVVPAATPSLSRGAAETALFSNKSIKDLNELTMQPIFLFDADVLEIMPAELSRDLLFLGREQSLPYSSIMEGSRVITAHMNRLQAGEWFTEQEFQAVYLHAYNNMVAEGKRSYVSNSKTASNIWWDGNVEENSMRIRKFLDYMLSSTADGKIEAPAFRLLEKHKQNQIYAMAIAKIEADGRIVGPIRQAWEKIVHSDIMSAGDKAEATANAFDELNRLIKIDEVDSDIGPFLAAYDQLVAMSSYLDREAILTTTGFTVMKDAAEKAKKPGRKKKTTAQVDKEFLDTHKEHLLKEQRARVDVVLDTLKQKEMKLREMDYKPEYGEVVDMVNDVATDGPKINWVLRTTDKLFSTFSYKYGMEEIRDIYGPITQNIIHLESAFTKGNVELARKWASLAESTGTDYPKIAIQKLMDIDEADFTEVMDLLNTVRIGFNPAVKGQLSADAAELVADGLAKLRQMLGDDIDDMMFSALSDIAGPLRYLFGANGKFAMQRGPITLYNSLLAKIGARNVGFNPNLSRDKIGEAWRELDWEQPFVSLNALHHAYAETERLMSLGIGTMQTAGARKISEFASLKEAEAQGYAKMRTVTEMKPDSGTEVMFFMDTENYVYPAPLIAEIETFSKFVSLPYKGFGTGFANFMRRFSGLQDFAKQAMTTLRPGNHLMNTMGIFFANDMAGLRNPARYYESIRVLRTIGIKESDMGVSFKNAGMAMEKFLKEQELAGMKLTPEAAAAAQGTGLSINLAGKVTNMPDDFLGEAFKRYGGIPPFQQTMNLDLLQEFSNAESLQKAVKSKGIKEGYAQLTGFAGNLAVGRDSWGRMALWLDILRKGKWDNFDQAAREAMVIVNRYHPQAQDISKANYVVTRQALLFFTWRAKMLGTVIYDLLERPGRLLSYEKAYYNIQAGMGNAPEYFGSHDPEDEPVRSFQQNTMGLLSADNEYSFSVANPMWDLLGTDGWLSAIKWDENQSPAANAFTITTGTAQQVLYSSQPLIGNFVLNWAQGRTSNGVDLMRGGITDQDVPRILEEAANAFGLNAYHALAAYYFPGIVDKGAWRDVTADERTKELLRAWFNWSTGARAQKYLTDDNRKKAYAELRSTLSTLTSRDQQAPKNTPGQSLNELIDYLQKVSE